MKESDNGYVIEWHTNIDPLSTNVFYIEYKNPYADKLPNVKQYATLYDAVLAYQLSQPASELQGGILWLWFWLLRGMDFQIIVAKARSGVLTPDDLFPHVVLASSILTAYVFVRMYVKSLKEKNF